MTAAGPERPLKAIFDIERMTRRALLIGMQHRSVLLGITNDERRLVRADVDAPASRHNNVRTRRCPTLDLGSADVT